MTRMHELSAGCRAVMAACAPAKRWWPLLVCLVLCGIWFQRHYTIGLNCSPSLPYRVFLIHKGEPVTRDNLVAFRWAGGGPYPAGVTFVKQLAGVPGDLVTRKGLAYEVNGWPVGVARTRSRQGLVLEPGPVGRLPAGRYYVQATHPDSLDSRYALTGWIEASQIIGRAHVLF